jgi:hypothetical protein
MRQRPRAVDNFNVAHQKPGEALDAVRAAGASVKTWRSKLR